MNGPEIRRPARLIHVLFRTLAALIAIAFMGFTLTALLVGAFQPYMVPPVFLGLLFGIYAMRGRTGSAKYDAQVGGSS